MATVITVLGEVAERRDTTASWNYTNPVLPDGQLGWEYASDRTPVGVKMGDGVTSWDSLDYWFGGILPLDITYNVVAGTTPITVTVAYTDRTNPTVLFRDVSGNNYTPVNYQDTGTDIVLTSPDMGDGTSADSYLMVIKA